MNPYLIMVFPPFNVQVCYYYSTNVLKSQAERGKRRIGGVFMIY